MNKYIVPVCVLEKSKVYNLIIPARSIQDCEERIMEKFSDYSELDNYSEFLDELDSQDILIGDIQDVETL